VGNLRDMLGRQITLMRWCSPMHTRVLLHSVNIRRGIAHPIQPEFLALLFGNGSLIDLTLPLAGLPDAIDLSADCTPYSLFDTISQTSIPPSAGHPILSTERYGCYLLASMLPSRKGLFAGACMIILRCRCHIPDFT
jgi:hypothetical protein